MYIYCIQTMDINEHIYISSVLAEKPKEWQDRDLYNNAIFIQLVTKIATHVFKKFKNQVKIAEVDWKMEFSIEIGIMTEKEIEDFIRKY